MKDIVSIVKKQEFPDVIDMLEDLLAKARAGEVESMAIVGRMPNGNLFSKRTRTLDKHHLLAGVLYLLHDLSGLDRDQ